MPEKIVKRVRRHDEPHYDVVQTASGKLESRPLDAATPKPAANQQPPAAKAGDTDTSARARTTEE